MIWEALKGFSYDLLFLLIAAGLPISFIVSFHIKCTKLYGIFYLEKQEERIGQGLLTLEYLKFFTAPRSRRKMMLLDSITQALLSSNLKPGEYEIETHSGIIDLVRAQGLSSGIILLKQTPTKMKHVHELIPVYGWKRYLKYKKKNKHHPSIYKQFYNITFRKL